MVGVGFGLGDLGIISTGAGASILTNFGVDVLEVTLLVLIVLAGLSASIFSRINFWLSSDNLENMGLATKSSQFDWFIGDSNKFHWQL